ncbi:UNVERIFIED_CONTAM: hypothetical protein ABID98_001314 [Brevibacillus sp. OAP136]
MKQAIYKIGYERVNKRELMDRLGLHDCLIMEHCPLQPNVADEDQGLPPEEERHKVLVRFQEQPSEWITFTGVYQIIHREPIPWLDSPMEYYLYGTELSPANIRREKAPQARIPSRTKLQITAIRNGIVYVSVPGHPSRRYEVILPYARFARDTPTELEMKLQVYAFPPRTDILVDWLLREGRKSGFVTQPTGERVQRSAFQVWDELRKGYSLSASAAILAIKQALLILDRAGVTSDFPYPVHELSDLSQATDEERDAFYSYHAVKSALAAVSALLTTDPSEPLQDLLLMDVMLEQQIKRKRES